MSVHYNTNDKKNKREETERHDKEMENNIRNIKTLQIGSGLKKKKRNKTIN